jgi:hypothetical protein
MEVRRACVASCRILPLSAREWPLAEPGRQGAHRGPGPRAGGGAVRMRGVGHGASSASCCGWPGSTRSRGARSASCWRPASTPSTRTVETRQDPTAQQPLIARPARDVSPTARSAHGCSSARGRSSTTSTRSSPSSTSARANSSPPRCPDPGAAQGGHRHDAAACCSGWSGRTTWSYRRPGPRAAGRRRAEPEARSPGLWRGTEGPPPPMALWESVYAVVSPVALGTPRSTARCGLPCRQPAWCADSSPRTAAILLTASSIYASTVASRPASDVLRDVQRGGWLPEHAKRSTKRRSSPPHAAAGERLSRGPSRLL